MPSRIRIFRSDDRAAAGPPALDGFLDALLQKFENCRDGLSDAVMDAGQAEAYFAGLYEPERSRLRDIVRREGSHLPEEANEEMYTQVDRLVREVVLPTYVRLAVPFTRRERNGFYLAPERLHAAERVGWAIAGSLVGAFVVWAPFIPLWSKEWVLPFFLGGLVLPELRRWWELRHYEGQLNRTVLRADAEVRRIDVNQLVLESPAPPGRAAGRALRRVGLRAGVGLGLVLLAYASCTARVSPNEFGVEQARLGTHVGLSDHPYGPGLYFVPPGTTMHTYSREIHVLEASNDREDVLARAGSSQVKERVEEYFRRRAELLGDDTDRRIEALNIQTSDGYAVLADVALLYRITDPVKVARDFGWGTTYVEAFVVNTFRNGVLTTLGKMNAEAFYDEQVRIRHVAEAEAILRERFGERGLEVERLLLRNYRYAPSYEKSLHDKKVAVQLTVKNERERIVNEEKAKLQKIESQGNATITIAESEVNAQISKVRAEAELYASQTRARADREIKVAEAEAKRLTAEALAFTGSRYVVGLETAKMFDNIQGAVMTPEQYVQFIRATWALIGLSPGGAPPPRAAEPPRVEPAPAGGAR